MPANLSILPAGDITRIYYSPPATENVEPKETIIQKPFINDKSTNSKKTDNSEIKELRKSLAEQNIALKFSRDQDTKILVVELVDNKTGEAILQLPSKVSLKLAAENAKLQGLFINKKV